MPPSPGLSDTQVWQLVTYVRSLQAIQPAAGVTAQTDGSPAAGETLFFGKAGCTTCHDVNGRGGIVGPDLSNAGRLPPAQLRQKIVDPNSPMATAGGGRGGGRGAPAPATVVARTPDGREIRGVRRNEDTFSLQMVDTSGQLHLLDKLKLASVAVLNTSLHPTDYATRFSADRDREPRRVSRHAEGARCEPDRRRAAAAGRGHLRAPAQLESRTAQLADVLGGLSGHALFPAEADRHDQRGPPPLRLGDAGAGTQRQREHSARRGRGDVRHQRRQSPHRDGDRRAHGTSDLAVHAPAEGGQPGRNRRRQSRRRDSRPPPVRRHERCGAPLPGRANGPAHLGGPGRRHHGRLQRHQPSAHREGQDHRRARRRRVRDPRLPRRLRRDREAAVAVLHDPRTGRAGQRYVEGRQLEDGRRRNVVDRHLRSGARHGVLADRQPGADDRPIGARRRRQPVHRFSGGTRPQYRPAQMALPVHAQRRARLGFDRGHGARRSRVARAEPEAPDARRSQRALLRARSHERGVSVRHAVHPPDVEQGLRREGAPDADPRVELAARGKHPRLPHGRRRDKFPGAVVQSDHRLLLSGVFRRRGAIHQRAAGH